MGMRKRKRVPVLSSEQISAFEAKVDKANANGCWPWLGFRMKTGHGLVCLHPRGNFVASVVSLVLSGVPQPEGVEDCCHAEDKCMSPGGAGSSCVRPSHLRFDTHKANVREGRSASAAHARKERCACGRAFTPSPTRPERVCVPCRKQTTRLLRESRASAGLCRDCGAVAAVGLIFCELCGEKSRVRALAAYHANGGRERQIARRAAAKKAEQEG